MGVRDSFYSAIEQALGRQGLDGDLFERLAAELVGSKGLPTQLVVGGADSGYDFGLLDTDREPGPGVVTTGTKVLDNLRRNLKRNNDCYPLAAKKTFVVTSQPLTPQRRRNLAKCAEESGFVLLGVADRAEVARYIYESPHWAKDLLQLSGRPAALSPVPPTSRQLLGLPLIGRGDALLSLRGGTRDMLLVGPPGSGKTALLAQLARDGLGAFLVDQDVAAIANALRAQKPQAVFIDDVSSPEQAVRSLNRLRDELAVDIRIVVTSWQRDSTIEQCLGVLPGDVVTLDRLTREQMVDVIRDAGVLGPVPLVREILDQAEGVPGLAVTLSLAALNGNVTELVHGDLLGSLMKSSVSRLLGRGAEGDEAVRVLAAVALASDDGLKTAEAASAMGMSATRVASVLKTLEPGGVVMPRGDRVVVRPRPLRQYLIREAFFATAPLDYRPVLEVTPDRGHAVIELARAQAAGAAIPGLLDLVIQSTSVMAARHFTALGRRETIALLAAAPELAVSVAREALRTAPDVVLPLLLSAALGDNREPHNSPDHPLRILKDWATAGVPGSREAVGRRTAVVRGALGWAKSGGNLVVAVRACCEVLPPIYEAQELDPGEGRRLTLSRGILRPNEIAQLEPLWKELLQELTSLQPVPWPSLLGMCHLMAFPIPGIGLPDDIVTATHALARIIVADLGELGVAHPAVLDRLNTLKTSLGEGDEFLLPEDYLVLFGDLDGSDWRGDFARRSERVDQLAEAWRNEPEFVAKRLAFLRAEAALVGSHLDESRSLCVRLAKAVEEPGNWLRALVASDASQGCIEPFLEKVAALAGPAWEDSVRPLLGSCAEGAVLSVVLQSPHVSDGLWSEISPRLQGCSGFIEVLCIRDQVPVPNLHRLLHHETPEVQAAAAVGMWQGVEHGAIPTELRIAWEDAVVESVSHDYWLREMLPTSRAMAEAWLMKNVERDHWRALSEKDNVEAAVSTLGNDRRLAVLRRLPGGSFDAELIQSIVGESIEVYSAMLEDPHLREHCDGPLRRVADATWHGLAVAALESGIGAAEVAAHSTVRWGVRWGPESAYVGSQIVEYEQWLSDSNEGIREVARLAIESLQERLSEALKREHDEAVEGLR